MSLDKMPQGTTAKSVYFDRHIFTLIRTAKQFSRVVIPFYTFSAAIYEGFSFSTSSLAYDMNFYFCYSNRCVVISCGSIFILILKIENKL